MAGDYSFILTKEVSQFTIHAEKADMECKFWILVDEVEIQEAFSFNLTPAAKKEIKKIIFQHFDLIAEAWNNHFKK